MCRRMKSSCLPGDCNAASTREQFTAVVDKYGLPRTNPAIWENFQWFVDYMKHTRPVEAGVYDLSRYKKVSELMSDTQG